MDSYDEFCRLRQIKRKDAIAGFVKTVICLDVSGTKLAVAFHSVWLTLSRPSVRVS